MDRNAESHFAELPQVDIQRSIFHRNSDLKTSFNAGSLIPIYLDEVLPGDTFSMDMSFVLRMSTPIFPTMDNAFLDYYWFFVPNRIIWQNSKYFFGETTQNTPWYSATEKTIPQLTFPSGGFGKGSLADYLGIPTTSLSTSRTINALPFRAYALIWNEWFRDQNLQDPQTVPLADANTTGLAVGSANSSNFVNWAATGAKPLPVAKVHDYFTSCLPAPQRGSAVTLPLGTSAPVIGNGKSLGLTNGTDLVGLSAYADGENNKNLFQTGAYNTNLNTTGVNATGKNGIFGVTTDGSKSGVVADLSNATAATVNALRQAFQIQKLLETDARSGVRYREILKAHFGVTSPDARMQVPEYLGGERVPINVNQVLQTSSTDSTSPQGNTAAYSATAHVSSCFTKSFTEHGYLMCVACVRTDHTYQQGIDRLFARKRRFDFYWPTLAHLGEQAVLVDEIYANDTNGSDAFGYQEAWAEYRYKPSKVTGAMRSTYTTPLDAWHYGDYYSSAPALSASWIEETTANIDRTLAVQSSAEDQFIADFYFKCESARPMPLYSVPGLIDHF